MTFNPSTQEAEASVSASLAYRMSSKSAKLHQEKPPIEKTKKGCWGYRFVLHCLTNFLLAKLSRSTCTHLSLVTYSHSHNYKEQDIMFKHSIFSVQRQT